MPLPTPPPLSDARAGVRYLLDLDSRLEKFDRSVLIADWNLYTGRSKRGAEPWQLRRAAFLSDPRLIPWVEGALLRGWPRLHHRRLELLRRVLLDTQVEQHPTIVRFRSTLARKVVAFRPMWKGRRVNRSTVNRVLWEGARSSDRRAAFYALEPLNRPMEGALRELVEMRNERARAVGFRTFAEMRLGFEGITPDRLEELSEGALAHAHRVLGAIRESHLASPRASGWHPWDVIYARTQQASLPDRLFPREQMVPRILRAFRAWGFPPEKLRFRVVFHDIPAGGLTLAPDPPRDIRVVVHPQGGWPAYDVMFHELGHAVHSACIRAPRHLLRWHESVPGFGGYHEGIAGVFEQLAQEPAWLATVPGIDRKRAEEFARVHADSAVMWAASTVSWFRVEQALYRRPEGDPTAEAHRLQRRLFGFDEFRPLSFVDDFFIETPVYAANYLLAALFSAQVRRTLRERFGEPTWPNPKVGPWLSREWFVHGSLYDWIPRVKEVTGRPFGPEAFRTESLR